MVCRVEGKFESAISFAIRTFTVKTLIVYFAYDRDNSQFVDKFGDFNVKN